MDIHFSRQHLLRLSPLLLVAVGWAYLFKDEFPLLISQWNLDDYSYCYLVPFVTAYVAWQKRKDITFSPDATNWPGFIGVLLAGAFLLAGRLGSLETFIFFSMWLSVVSIAIVMLGLRNATLLIFPAIIFLFIIPPPSFIEKTVSFNLRLLSSELSAQLLTLLQVPVYLEGNIIDLGSIRLQVVDACSGLRYFLPTILLSLIIGHALNRTLTGRILLVLLSAPITIALNTIRITITGLLTRYISPALADGFFHDFQGWLIYLAAIALLAGSSFVIKRFEKQPEVEAAPAPDREPEQEQALGQQEVADAHAADVPISHGMPMLSRSASLAVSFVALSLALTLTVKAQSIPAWSSLETFPLQIGDWSGTRSYLDKEALDALWADDYFLASYRNTTTGSSLNLLIPYYKSQTAQHTAHAPTSCLLGSGWEVVGRKILDPSPETGRRFIVQQLILSKNGQHLLSNFWFQQRGRIIASELKNKAYLLYDALTMRRTDGALVRIEMVIPRGSTAEQAQVELDGFSAQVQTALSAHLPNEHGLKVVNALP